MGADGGRRDLEPLRYVIDSDFSGLRHTIVYVVKRLTKIEIFEEIYAIGCVTVNFS